jgi:hypothetical protein
MDAIFNEEMPRARLALLLEHFSQIDDDRELWRVVYPLAEVLLLLTCATITSCEMGKLVQGGSYSRVTSNLGFACGPGQRQVGEAYLTGLAADGLARPAR